MNTQIEVKPGDNGTGVTIIFGPDVPWNQNTRLNFDRDTAQALLEKLQKACLTHTNSAWTMTDPNRNRFLSEISELNVHPSQPLRDPWNRVLDPGMFTARKKDGDIEAWDVTVTDPYGANAVLVIIND